jgi:hypothetical protein
MTSKYEVGYGKPPAAGRFKKGASGNPKGRRKGVRNISTVVEEVLNERIAVTERGRRRSITTLEALVRGLRADALSGNQKSRLTMVNLAFQVEAKKEGMPPPNPASMEADSQIMARLVERIRSQVEKGKKP